MDYLQVFFFYIYVFIIIIIISTPYKLCMLALYPPVYYGYWFRVL